MWPQTGITEILKISLPIIQAPMAGGATTPALVAAVSEAGGLGSLAVGYTTPDEIRKLIRAVRELTARPFAVNLFIPGEHHANAEQIEQASRAVEACCQELNFKLSPVHFPYSQSFAEQLTVLLEEKISIFSFTFGIPEEKYLRELQANGVILIGTATNLAEATLLEEKGIDIIAAQGSEAGGHRGTFLGKAEDSLHAASSLTRTLVDNVRIPVLASGGIMDAEGIVAALDLGAAGVQMGTAFLTCPESGTHPAYKELLLKSSKDETMLTKAFSGKFARGIKNKFMRRMESHTAEILDYPIQNALTAPMRKAAAMQNLTDFMSLFAGQKAYLSRGMPAAELVRELNDKVMALLVK